MYACSIVRGGRASATRFAIEMRKASRMHLEGSVPTTLGSGGRFEDEDIDLFEIRDSEMTRSRSARLTTVLVTANIGILCTHTVLYGANLANPSVSTSPESVLVMLPPVPNDRSITPATSALSLSAAVKSYINPVYASPFSQTEPSSQYVFVQPPIQHPPHALQTLHFA